MAVVPSPGVRVAVAESLIRDHGRVTEWCDLCGMKLNANKTKTMIVSRSRTVHPQSPPLAIGGTVLQESEIKWMTSVPVRVTSGALVAHRYTYAPPRCRTLQYSRTFIPFLVSLYNDLANPVFNGVGLAGFKSRASASLLA